MFNLFKSTFIEDLDLTDKELYKLLENKGFAKTTKGKNKNYSTDNFLVCYNHLNSRIEFYCRTPEMIRSNKDYFNFATYCYDTNKLYEITTDSVSNFMKGLKS